MDSFMEKCRSVCDIFYQSLRIPVYAYRKNDLLYSSAAEPLAIPPDSYIERIRKQKDAAFFTDYGVCFARLDADEDPDMHLILGPVTTLPLQRGMLFEMYRDYHVPPEQRERFRSFHLQIPTMTYLEFYYHLIAVFYALNGRVITVTDLVPAPSSEDTTGSRRKQAEKMYQQKEAQMQHSSLELENMLLSIVRSGDVEGIRKFIDTAPRYQAGVIADTPLRLQKNYFITTVTLMTRAAMEGGLSEEQAFQFSDLYISKMETLSDLRSVNTLFLQAMDDITMQVAAKQSERHYLTFQDISGIAQNCMDYVQKHTHSALSVQSVADAMGYHRSYLSASFTKAAGITLGEYIYRCKLEESHRLLQYTSKGISEISDTLCFSNQSHFVQRFKKQYGITPAKFRESLKKRN